MKNSVYRSCEDQSVRELSQGSFRDKEVGKTNIIRGDHSVGDVNNPHIPPAQPGDRSCLRLYFQYSECLEQWFGSE